MAEKVASLGGEFGFINLIRSRITDPAGIRGIGDDCAVLPMNSKSDLVVTTDLLIEDVHFILDDITAAQLAYKSAAVNLSDIAAMGARPIGCFLSIALPKDITARWADQFIESFIAICDRFGATLLGGDTTSSKGPLAINVAVLGKVPCGRSKLRSSAREGDIICCTGTLGDSGAGLDVVLSRVSSAGSTKLDADAEWLVRRHYEPTPRIQEGLLLGELEGVHAMMDISDGIASDLNHILKASSTSSVQLGADIHVEQLPLSSKLRRWSAANGKDAKIIALTAGEDYELLLTLDPKDFDLARNLLAPLCSLTAIGEITASHKGIRYMDGDHELNQEISGFTHF
ncbi:MAG: thiamine-phosphate kinase [Bacteroidales bacterium]|nr:thiamine-phosphate kinase [Bacteroidales bacterium]